uniref:Clp protease ATP binding subunit n=1 Tax=Babesia rodhaini TaxID=5870 RepID=A0A455R284_BABRO|nr:Clp protease ATP binding subunit [Babesia rodhaini]
MIYYYYLNNSNYINNNIFNKNMKLLNFRNFDYYLRFTKFNYLINYNNNRLFKLNIFSNLLKKINLIYIYINKLFFLNVSKVSRLDLEKKLFYYFNNFYYNNYKLFYNKNLDNLNFIIYYFLFISKFNNNIFYLFLNINNNNDYFYKFYKYLNIFIKDNKFIKFFNKNKDIIYNNNINDYFDIKKNLIFYINNKYTIILDYFFKNNNLINYISNINLLNNFIFDNLLITYSLTSYFDNFKIYNYFFLNFKKIYLFNNSLNLSYNINKYNLINIFFKFKKKLKFENCISNFIFGQEDQLYKLTTVGVNNLFNKNITNSIKPLGSWIICGPSGTGKTETSKIIYKILNNNRLLKFIKFDMSEFTEKHTSSRLIGSPPGYVGYSKGGELTNFVKENPNCIILFDEVEKANKYIYDLLLQVLDEGILTDSKGYKVRFNKSILIFVSNISSNNCKYKNIKFYNLDIINKLRKFFRIEFLNRLDNILIYKNLNLFSIYKILDKYLNNISSDIFININKFKLILSLIFLNNKCTTRQIIKLINNFIINKIIKLSNSILININNKSILYNYKKNIII